MIGFVVNDTDVVGGRGLPVGLAVDSPEFWARAERVPASGTPDQKNALTVRMMVDQIHTAARDPLVREYAQSAVRQFRGGPVWAVAAGNIESGDGGRWAAMAAESVWWWARVYVKFVHHSRLIWDRLRERDQQQLLISPDVLVRQRPMKGDCAVYSSLVAAMLEALGIGWELVTIACNPYDPGVYSHVYVRAVLPDGQRLSLDGSHGTYPGWQVPAHDVFRLQVWNAAGRPVADRGARWGGLHHYAFSRGRARRPNGLGVAPPNPVDPSDDWQEGGSYMPPSPGVDLSDLFGSGGPSYGGGGGTNWGGVFTGLLNQWTQIGGRVLAPTVSVQRGPNGQLSYSAPAGSSDLTASSVLASSSGSSLLWIGGGVVALVLVGMAVSKR